MVTPQNSIKKGNHLKPRRGDLVFVLNSLTKKPRRGDIVLESNQCETRTPKGLQFHENISNTASKPKGGVRFIENISPITSNPEGVSEL
jgi:hypothetical protein